MKKLLLFLLLLFIPYVQEAHAISLPDRPQGYVSDYANILRAEEKDQIEQKLVQLEKQTSAEIAIVTTSSLEGASIEEYSVKLFEKWGIGKKGKDNGLLIVIAPTERQARIEVGYGLEPVVTDAESSWIIRNTMLPAFKQNNYYLGISNAVDRIGLLVNKEAAPLPNPTTVPIKLPPLNINLIIFAFMIVYGILASTKSWWFGGILGGIAGIILGLVYGFVLTGIIALALLIPLGLIVDFIASKQGHKPTSGTGPWWTSGGGFGGGGGGRSGGFGGFGGGRSGGGGSSGRW